MILLQKYSTLDYATLASPLSISLTFTFQNALLDPFQDHLHLFQDLNFPHFQWWQLEVSQIWILCVKWGDTSFYQKTAQDFASLHAWSLWIKGSHNAQAHSFLFHCLPHTEKGSVHACTVSPPLIGHQVTSKPHKWFLRHSK